MLNCLATDRVMILADSPSARNSLCLMALSSCTWWEDLLGFLRCGGGFFGADCCVLLFIDVVDWVFAVDPAEEDPLPNIK